MNFKKRVNGSWTEIPYYLHNTSTDTITTLPADIYANAATATVGLKGQTVQSGTPTPQNPAMPEGCGNMTGNLCDESTVQNGYYSGVLVYFANDNYRCFVLTLDAGTYTIKATITNNAAYLLRISSTTLGVNQINTYTQYTFTLEERDTVYISLRNRDTTTDFTDLKIMLNSGSTALPYEPYGVKIPISSAGQTTPVYLGGVQTTRKIKKLVLTGQEDSWYTTNNFFYNDNINPDYLRTSTSYRTVYCTHYQGINNVTSGSQVGDGECAFYSSPGVQRLYIKDSSYTTVADFKTYLQQQYSAGTPVTVWYVLAKPETAVVNEPLQKIGDYADALSNVSIPVTAGGDTISVGTTVQPSEVTANYKGWHPKTPKESNNGQWS